MKLVLLITCLVVLFILYFYLRDRTTLSFSYLDNRYYNVQKGFKNHRDATLLMSKTNNKLNTLFRYLRDKYRIDDVNDPVSPTDDYRRRVVDSILHRYDPDEIYETNPMYTTDTSFTVNKGDYMNWCVRSKKNPEKLVDENVLMFVVLHEVAHIGAFDVLNHAERFWEVFKFLLKEARAAGIYTPVDYSIFPMEYCGMVMTYNPYFDTSIRGIGLD